MHINFNTFFMYLWEEENNETGTYYNQQFNFILSNLPCFQQLLTYNTAEPLTPKLNITEKCNFTHKFMA
jgi:hypothetical protein